MAALWNASDEALEEKADAAAQMGRAEGASELAEVKKTRGVNFEQIVRVCQCVCVCVYVEMKNPCRVEWLCMCLSVAFRKYAELSAAKDKELQATGLQRRSTSQFQPCRGGTPGTAGFGTGPGR